MKEDYRAILQKQFELRKARRPRYSLRAFARDLGVKASTLTGVLYGRHGISGDTAQKIARQLNFDTDQTEVFVDMVESEHARNKVAREQAGIRLKARLGKVDFSTLSEQQMSLFEHWYYPAVLELVTAQVKSYSLAEIAQRLNISLAQAQEAMEVLLQLQIIKKEGGQFVRSHRHLSGLSPVPSEVVRSFHRQIMKLASEKIERQPIAEREFLSTVFSFDKSKVDEAKKWLEKMHFEFLEKFSTDSGADSVYGLAVQFFKMTDEGEV